MPTIDDMRKYFSRPPEKRSDSPPTEPKPEPEEEKDEAELLPEEQGVNMDAVARAKYDRLRYKRKRSMNGRYTTDGHGDATLSFGKHKGKTVGELASGPDGRSYLRWMLKQEFPEDLLEIVKSQLVQVRM